MLFKYCNCGLSVAVVLFGLCARFNAVAEGEEKFRVEGRALVYGVRTEEWTPLAHVLLDGEEHVGFVRLDGSFTVNDVPSGSYVLHIVSPVYRFEPVRVDITATGKMRARRVNYIKTSELINMNDPGMRREMEQSMNMLNPSPELPDVSELMTKFFAPPKSQGKSGTHRGHRGSGPRRR